MGIPPRELSLRDNLPEITTHKRPRSRDAGIEVRSEFLNLRALSPSGFVPLGVRIADRSHPEGQGRRLL